MSVVDVQPPAPWRSLGSKPRYALTADQDWAPRWAMAAFLRILEEERVPLHLFATNACGEVDDALERGQAISMGVHPNIREGSSHGKTITEVVDFCRNLVPRARTFRTHTFAENSTFLHAMREQGFLADANVCLIHQPNLVPLFQASGLLRFPTYLEDDIFWVVAGPELDLAPLRTSLFTPGLKILNFHPLFVACNLPSTDYYLKIKEFVFTEEDVREKYRFPGRGTEDVLRGVCASIREAGLAFEGFEGIVDQAFAELKAFDPPYLYGKYFAQNGRAGKLPS